MIDYGTNLEELGLPIFLINGFLQSGKTSFLTFTMNQEYFQTAGRTLLIACEEGELSYDEELLTRTRTTLLQIDDISQISKEKILEYKEAYDPERILIEWNGMWNPTGLEIPDGFFINQQITIIDTSTLDVYLKNMKPLFGPMLKNSELVICNRADDIPEEMLSSFHLSLKAMANTATIIFEGAEGEITGDFSIDLPYDIESSHIDIEQGGFGIFYLDVMDRGQKYHDKEVTLIGQVLRPRGIPDNYFVIGRMAMTCCEADMQFLGLLCIYENSTQLKSRDWAKITARISYEENSAYDGEGPVLYVKEVEATAPIESIILF